MLADAGAQLVIVGHSERRADHGETDELVRAKALAALAAGLDADHLRRRDRARARGRAGRRRVSPASWPARCPTRRPDDEVVVAYEPVWAIGTGLTPTIGGYRRRCTKSLRDQLVERFGERGASDPAFSMAAR